MSTSLRAISSMATRQLLGELAAAWRERSGIAIALESVGGVDAARRIQAGEPFDAVFLASDAIDKLIAAGSVVPGSRVDLFHSGVAVAVRAGAPQPAIDTEAALRAAVLAAPSIGHSTGPSGVALLRLFERWGIGETLRGRIVQAPPGVPVGTLVARGEVALGFQQLSELIDLPGIDVVGPLPGAVQITTTFSGAVRAGSPQPDAVHALLAFLTAPDAAAAVRRRGMEPA